MLRRLCFLMGFLALSASAENSPEKLPSAKLNLRALLERAGEKNIDLVKARNAREEAESSLTIARSALLPSLAFSSSIEHETSLTGAEPVSPWTSSASIALKQTLFKNGTLWRTYQSAEKDLEENELQEKNSREAFALNLVKAFAQTSLLSQKLKSAERREKLLALQHDIVKRQYTQGMKTRKDYHRLDAEMERSKLQHQQAQESLTASLRTLETLIGDEGFQIQTDQVEILVGEKIMDQKNWNFAASAADVTRKNLDIKAQALEVEKSDLGLQEATWGLWPQVNLTAGLQYGSSNFVGDARVPWNQNDGTQFVAGITLNWTLWNWGAQSAVRAKARSNRFLSERNYAQKTLEVSNNTENLIASLERLRKTLVVEKRIRDLEHSNFEEIQREYREGQANYLDLITALDQDINSENSFEDQASQYFTTVAELKKLNGDLYDSILAL